MTRDQIAIGAVKADEAKTNIRERFADVYLKCGCSSETNVAEFLANLDHAELKIVEKY